MSRKFIATIAAASIAVTSLGAVPVQAQERNRSAEQAIAAILGFAIVGKIIHDQNKRNDRAKRQQGQHVKPAPQPRRIEQVQPRPLPRRVERQHSTTQKRNRRVNKRLLPRQCFRSFQTNRGTYRGFGNRCLQNNFRHAHLLPQYCKTRIRTDRGPRRVYEARCLRDAGYRLARG